MPNIDEIRNLLVVHNRRLQILREQRAKFGELHVPPHIVLEIEYLEEEISTLQTEIQNGSVHLSALNVDKIESTEVIPLPEPRIPRHFKDRIQETNTLIHLAEKQSFCGLFGMGGSGKTILAAYVAHQVRMSEQMPVIWLSLNQETDAEKILETLARALGHSLRTIPDTYQRGTYLRGISEGMNLFIVFDDVNEDALLEKLLDAVGTGNSVLITSRNQDLRSIQKFGVEIILLNPLPMEAATEVLLELSGNKDVSVSEINAWQNLAKAVGHLPLALEVIAGDIRFRSKHDPIEYLESQIKSGRWLKNEDLEERLSRALQQSIDQLSQDYKLAFACLAVFTGGGFDAEAVKAVCNITSDEETENLLVTLRKRILLRDMPDDTITLHPAVREFAQKQLDLLDIETKNLNSPVGRYIQYYQRLLGKFGGYEWNISQYANLIPQEFEVFNAINSAYKLWIDRECTDRNSFGNLAIQMTFLVSWYLLWRGYWDLRIQFCRQITDELENSGLLQNSFGQFSNMAGNLYVDRGWIHLRRGEYEKVRYCVTKAEQLMGRVDRKFAVELKAQLALKLGNTENAYELFSELRDQVRKNTRPWFVFSYRFSDCLVDLGKEKDAINLLEDLIRRIPNVTIMSNEIISDTHACITYRLAELLKSYDRQASKKLLEETVQLFGESGIVDRTSIAAKMGLAGILLPADHKRTKNLLIEALVQARTIGELTLVHQIEDMLNNISES